MAVNAWLACGFDAIAPFPPESAGTLDPQALRGLFTRSHAIADVGGGKKPFAVKAGLDVAGKVYVGLDLDPGELARAPAGSYTQTARFDLCAPDPRFAGRFDLVICRSTLEHVADTEAAVAAVIGLLAPGGHGFVKLPCRQALFARLNRRLPQQGKRWLLHGLFPHKRGDGFPARYDRCTPSALRALVARAGGEVLAEKRNYRSSYFRIFFPLYLVWRAAATAQFLLDRDYCESFELVVRKPV